MIAHNFGTVETLTLLLYHKLSFIASQMSFFLDIVKMSMQLSRQSGELAGRRNSVNYRRRSRNNVLPIYRKSIVIANTAGFTVACRLVDKVADRLPVGC